MTTRHTVSERNTGARTRRPAYAPEMDSYEQYRNARRKSLEEKEKREQTVYYRAIEPEKRKRKILLYFLLIAAIAVILFSLALLVRYISDSRAYTRYMQAAQVCTLGGDYDNSLAYLRKAAAIDMSDECLLMMAQCYEAQENYDRAIEALRFMTSSDSAISAKIASIEVKKKNKAEEGNVIVAGTAMDQSTSSLVLDNQGLGNGVCAELSALYAMNNLSIAGNGISDISPLAALGGLATLNLSNNEISNLSPLSNMVGLRTLYLDNNPISDFSPLYGLSSLASLSIKGISISDTALKELSTALPNCAINGVKSKNDTQMMSLGGVAFSADTTSLDLSGKGITDISVLAGCERLTSINLSNNSISDITPLMDIPNLQSLNISGNNISDLRPLMGIAGLKILNASSNSISSTVSLGSNTALVDLNLENNHIRNFSGLSKLKNLTNLNLSNTGFSDSDTGYFSYLSQLVYLNVKNNPGFTGAGYNSLRAAIPACGISHSDLSYSLETGGVTITSDATDLNMSGRGISDLSFLTQMNCLQSVRLSNNFISNIYYFQYTDSWRTITYLDLSENNISDITALSNLRALTTLNLTGNQIQDLSPLYSMATLRELYIGGNPLSEDQIRELNAYLPSCMIVFY